MSPYRYTHAISAVVALALAAACLVDGVTHERANAAIVSDAGPEPPQADSPAKADPPAPPPRPPPAPDLETFTARVLPGDSLSKIFARHGLPARDLDRLVRTGHRGKQLADIRPGFEFEFGRDADDNLIHVKYRPGRWETVEFQRVGDGFKVSEQVKTPDVARSYRHGTIEHSLFEACLQAGLGGDFAMRLADIFKWDIDMILEVRKGDEFHVLYEEQRIDGEFVGYGAILAAEFVNQGESYKAIRYVGSAGAASYYSPSGKNMRKFFLRAPLDFTRISSNFNLRRLHPLWKNTVPHLGIDYAAPTGTPVKAAGNGVVAERGKTSSKGNYIVIQHGTRYQTKYLHLSRFARGIKVGQRVEQGEVIGRVGATGWATGPHLHYEFLVDGRHRNPRTVSLPPSEPVGESEFARFEAATKPLLAALEDFKTGENEQVALIHQPSGPS